MTIAAYTLLALSLALVLSLRRIGPAQIEWWLIYAVMVASALMGVWA